MRRVLVVSILLLFLTTALPAMAAEERSESYVAGFGVTIWCSAEPHPILPGTPDEDDLHEPGAWAFSGEPECAYQDAMNIYREAKGEERVGGGLGGAAVLYGSDDVGKTIMSTPEDGLSGVYAYHTLYARGEQPEQFVAEEGCGVLSAVLPQPVSGWPDESETQGILWDSVEVMGVDDALNVCASSIGLLHYEW